MLRGLARAAVQRQGALRTRGSGGGAGVPVHVVDLRSDTVTKPGPAMRRAMAEAVVGDDDYGEDPTVRGEPGVQVRLLAQSCGVRVHLDGARLMNAAVALHVPPARIVEHCDSVSLCFSKGLGAPVGALVGGPKDFIEGAWRLRKALGGGMRQAGVLAAAALVGLADVEEVLLRDHQNARRFAQGLQELASPICSVDLAAVETNMVMVTVDGLPPQELCRRLQAVSADEVAQTGRAVRVLLFPWTGRSVRAVWHRDVSARDTELALRKWGFVLKQLGALRTG
ncbi:probable low-specificity L-threonine aldolase 2 [Puma concolor]|uniref:Probable low-specificity L-threonine aldolase 2 n=1 Tax=Puma concolor TaxID=9696 RepID=A0A6P6I5D1_PUMCO|nr:probable low-specificity L-threonine aldolase 2 [Puma concolor]